MIGRKVLATAGMVDWDEDERRMAIVFDFWDRAARAYRFDDGTPSGVGRRRRGHAVPRPRRRARRRSAGRSTAIGSRASRGSTRCSRRTCSCSGSTPDPATRTPARTCSTTVACCCCARSTGSARRTSRGARRSRASMPYSDVLAAFVLDGVDLQRDRLRDVGDEPRGLPLARRRVRAVRRRAPACRSRSTTTVSTRSRPRPRPRNASCTARSRGWSAAPRSTRARTCTSRSCGRSPSSRVSTLDWTVPRDSIDLYPFLELVDGELPGRRGGGDRRHVLPADSVTRCVAAADERAHAPGGAPWWWETWHLDVATDDGVGLAVRLACAPALGVAWWWTHLLLPDLAGPVVVRDHEVGLPRQGLEVRADGLWGELFCETPFEHWTYGLEAFGVRLDDPADSLRGEIGERMPVGLDIEWEVDADAAAPHEHRRDWPRRRVRAVRRRARRGAARPIAVRARRGRPAIAHVGCAAVRPAGRARRGCTRARARGRASSRSRRATRSTGTSRSTAAAARADLDGSRARRTGGADGLPVAARHVVDDGSRSTSRCSGWSPCPIAGRRRPAARARCSRARSCRYEVDGPRCDRVVELARSAYRLSSDGG